MRVQSRPPVGGSPGSGGVSGPASPGRLAPVAGRPAVLSQTWAEIVWAHWRVPVPTVRDLVPSALQVDTFDGPAWVGLVPFEMQDLRLVAAGRRLPGVGSTRSFSEINVRTYVTGPAGPGVWFHSLDATSRLAVAVARGVWSLPYYSARVERSLAPAHRWWAVSRRGHGRRPPAGAQPSGRIGAAIGSPRPADPLADFLTARFRLYAPLGRRILLTAPVRHEAWPLREATLDDLDVGLVEAAGYPIAGRYPDHVVAADPVRVAVGLPSLIRP